MINIEDVGDKEAKDKELGDIWWEALESKTHMEEGIPKEPVAGKPKEEHITCGYVVKNFWNWSLREATVRLENNMGSNPDQVRWRNNYTMVLYCGDL